MGKTNKGQKPSKSSKDVFSLEKVADVQQSIDAASSYAESGDVIAGFDFLKSFLGDDGMGDSPLGACLRKMAKKDTTTKIKALQDFIELVNSSEHDLIPCIQFWSRCYCRLTMCGDHRVRELAQVALNAVISKSGRQFATCLKTVMPYCILSHADCVQSVASAAKNCLDSNFNETRRVQAVSMCTIPTLELIASIINGINPYLADKSLGLDEEEALRVDRLLAACLGGWCFIALNKKLSESFSGSLATSGATESDDSEKNLVETILKSTEFASKIVKSNSPSVLSALNVWIVTMSSCCTSLIGAHSKLLLSNCFRSPTEGEAMVRTVDVGSWQSLAALLNIVGEELWKAYPQVEKSFVKRFNELIVNGPPGCLPPPSPFFAVTNLSGLSVMSVPVTSLLNSYCSNIRNEEVLTKFCSRFFESAQQGFQKMKPFHVRHQELSTFCEAFVGSIRIFLSKANGDLRSSVENGALKIFFVVVKNDPLCVGVILPYFVDLFSTISRQNNEFAGHMTASMKVHLLQTLCATDEPQSGPKNLALFFNLLWRELAKEKGSAVNPNEASLFLETMCIAIVSMKTTPIPGNILEFLSLLSSDMFASKSANPSSFCQLKSEFKAYVDDIVANWNSENADWLLNVVTKLFLRWNFLLSSDDLSRLLQVLCRDVSSLSGLLTLINRLDVAFRTDEHIMLLCKKVLTCTTFFESPEESKQLLVSIFDSLDFSQSSSELFTMTVLALLDDVATVLSDSTSTNYLGRLVHDSSTKIERDNLEEFLTWLSKGERPSIGTGSLVPKPLLCFVDVFQRFLVRVGVNASVSDKTIQSLLTAEIALNCYRSDDNADLLDRPIFKSYDRILPALPFVCALRDLVLFSKANFSRLGLEVMLLLRRLCKAKSGSCLDVTCVVPFAESREMFHGFNDLLENWLISNCLTSATTTHAFAIQTQSSNDSSSLTHLKNLIFAVGSLVASRQTFKSCDSLVKRNFAVIIEAVSAVELFYLSKTPFSSSWLSDVLLELTDALLVPTETSNEVELLNSFISHCRSQTTESIRPRLAFSYLLNGRHSSSAIAKITSAMEGSLVSKFENSNDDDLWLLSETFNRIIRSGRKLTPSLVGMLKSTVEDIFSNLQSSNSSSTHLSSAKLKSLSQMATVLTNNFCDILQFEEDAVRNVLKLLTSSSFDSLYFRENVYINLENTNTYTQLDRTADLAIFFDCCFRYTPKLANIDAVMCSLCSWLSTIRNIISSAQLAPMLNFGRKTQLYRFLLATTGCVHTVHRLFSSSSSTVQFKFTPSESQKREFAEFYQLQYLDALIQLLMTLWLPLPAYENNSFFAEILKNRNVQDSATYAIVSCIYKASSVDVISHVHFDALFCADESYLPEDVQTIIGRLSPLITDTSVDDVRVHIAIYAVLQTLNPSLAGIYLSLSNNISQQQDSDDDFVLTPPRIWLREIAALTGPVSIAVASDSWRTHPEPVSGYLFAWLLVLRLTGSLPSEVRSPMVNFLRKSPDFQALLLNTFAVAPLVPQSVDPAPFDTLPQLENSSEAIPLVGHLSCYLIRELLVTIPSVVRSWLNEQPVSLRRDIIAYVSNHLSPQLRAAELSKVRQAEFDEAIKVRVMTASGELVASYQADALRLDLTISLPDDYPLSAPTIECKQNVLSNACKLWLRQLTAFLICQNGAVLDGLMLWQKLITDKLGKLEECTICYSIVQGGNMHLPKRQCKTCKKRFHAACLYRWFDTSGNMTCPLCREQFY